MMGLPSYPDHPIPSWDEFCGDYQPHYFDDSQPVSGRCFVIVADGRDLGVFCHNAIVQEGRVTELDIWLRAEAYCGKGYGTAALEVLCARLHEEFEVEEFIVRPSRRNSRAIAAYQKAGFELVPLRSDETKRRFGDGDYEDALVLLKRLG